MSAPSQTASSAAQAAQTGLVLVAGRDVQAALAQLDTTDLRQSLPPFKTAVAAITTKYGLASAALAVRQYKTLRSHAGVKGSFQIRPAPPASLEQVARSIDWATQSLWAQEPDMAVTQVKVAGAAERLVLEPGRRTIVDNTHRDPATHGYARLTEPAPCAFCALLATRGAVYRSEKSGDFQAHDHCRCHAEPLFEPYRASDDVKRWRDLYYSSTSGKKGANAVAEFRKAFDAAQG